MEDELRKREWVDRLFTHARSREELMIVIDKERASTVYPHEQCSDECKKRGMFHLIACTHHANNYACVHALDMHV